MNSETIAWIIIQAINAGVDMRNIAGHLDESGAVDPETWQEIADNVKGANQAWENAEGPKV